MPEISFIIPCYNARADHLRECLGSLCDAAHCEVILVDDGSTEWHDEIVKELADGFSRNAIHFNVLHRPHEGVSAARNAGMDIAQGRYIQFVDADDSVCWQTLHSDVERATLKDADMMLYGKGGQDKVTDGISYMRRNNIHGAVWHYLFRRELVEATDTHEALRFTPGVAYAEDEEFTARLMLRANNVITTDDNPVSYRRHEQSATADMSPERLRQRFDDTERVITRLRDTAGTLQGEARQALQRRVAQLTMDYLYNVITLTRDRKQMEEHIKRLRQLQLFPLPVKHYTTRYLLFSLMSTNRFGRQLLFRQCLQHATGKRLTNNCNS